MFKPQRLGFDELSERLRAYEEKYGYSTIEFYRRYANGELGDDDDLMMWAGLYHLSEIVTHPHHKHIGPSDRLAPADQPSLSQVLAEIEGWLGG